MKKFNLELSEVHTGQRGVREGKKEIGGFRVIK